MYGLVLQLFLIALITTFLNDISCATDGEGASEPSLDTFSSGFDDFVNLISKDEVPDYDWIRTVSKERNLTMFGSRDMKGDGSPSRNLSVKKRPSFPIYIGITRTFPDRKSGEASLYLNGDFLTEVTSKETIRFFRISASPGDVIAAQATSTAGPDGIAMILKVGNDFFPTGGSGYKAMANFRSPIWNHRQFRACSWHEPIPLQITPESRLGDAAYVWAARSGDEGAYFRFVIGGEDCSQPKPKIRKYRKSESKGNRNEPRRSPEKKRYGKKDSEKSHRVVEPQVVVHNLKSGEKRNKPRRSFPSKRPRGKKDSEKSNRVVESQVAVHGLKSRKKPSNPRRSSPSKKRRRKKGLGKFGRAVTSQVTKLDSKEPCDCKQVGRDDECYVFATLRLKNGNKIRSSHKCVRQACGSNFECVENGEPFTHRCIAKAVTFKVAMVDRLSNDVFKCRRLVLKKPVVVLVPHRD